MKDKRSTKSYKLHKRAIKLKLLSCALRCSSKLQKIQSLENFVSMTIQGIQVPMYTKHTVFVFFLFFNYYYYFYMKKKKKPKLKRKKTKTN